MLIEKMRFIVTDLIDPNIIPLTPSEGWQPDPAHPRRRPPWIKVRAPSSEGYREVFELMRSKKLNTVCEEAQCPNIAECWGKGTATFLLGGAT